MSLDWDPRTWEFSTTKAITLDRMGDVFCLVSAEDYEWARMNGPWFEWKARGISYARTFITVPDGRRIQFYLHRLIMLRAKIHPPSRYHVCVDHINRDGLNCTRENLRWATKSQNAKNIRKWAHEDLFRDADEQPR